jgi:Cu-Zn family superoxide dismutase
MAEGPADRGERARLPDGKTAHAILKDSNGNEVGRATLTETNDGVRIAGEVHGLPPGEHGFHIHEQGICEAPAFTSAGGHFNPTGESHGAAHGDKRHLGDLGNLRVGEDGRSAFDVTAEGARLTAGDHSLFHPGGTSLMVHAKLDDLKTNPSGNSGDRIACGVITRD